MISFKAIGKELVENGWGKTSDTDLEEATRNADVNECIRNVLCYIANKLAGFSPVIAEAEEIRKRRWDKQFDKLFNLKYKYKTSTGLRRLVRDKTHRNYLDRRYCYVYGNSVYEMDIMELSAPSRRSKYYKEFCDTFGGPNK